MSESDSKPSAHGREVNVTIINEDDGREFVVSGTPQSTVGEAIEKMYASFIKRARRNGDRLRCESTGEDVFPHASDHLQGYVASSCRGQTWVFVSETGGA